MFPSEENVEVGLQKFKQLLSYERTAFPEVRLIRVPGHEALVIRP